jgi:hypothetical protein
LFPEVLFPPPEKLGLLAGGVVVPPPEKLGLLAGGGVFPLGGVLLAGGGVVVPPEKLGLLAGGGVVVPPEKLGLLAGGGVVVPPEKLGLLPVLPELAGGEPLELFCASASELTPNIPKDTNAVASNNTISRFIVFPPLNSSYTRLSRLLREHLDRILFVLFCRLL